MEKRDIPTREWERRELSLRMRILLQVLRFALAALFFYIAYLGIIWRSTAPTPVPKQAPTAAPAKPVAPAQQAPKASAERVK